MSYVWDYDEILWLNSKRDGPKTGIIHCCYYNITGRICTYIIIIFLL